MTLSSSRLAWGTMISDRLSAIVPPGGTLAETRGPKRSPHYLPVDAKKILSAIFPPGGTSAEFWFRPLDRLSAIVPPGGTLAETRGPKRSPHYLPVDAKKILSAIFPPEPIFAASQWDTPTTGPRQRNPRRRNTSAPE